MRCPTWRKLFSLQTTKIKLDADWADAQSKITALYTPPLSDRH
jgi:hypothetical protein